MHGTVACTICNFFKITEQTKLSRGNSAHSIYEKKGESVG
jgi:hypothetical protein